MSGLLSSLVSPVVRQARRFSGVPTSDTGDGRADAATLSHVSAESSSSSTSPLHRRASNSSAGPSDSSSRTRGLPRPEFIARLRRLVTPSVIPTAETSPWTEYEHSAHSQNESAISESPPLHSESRLEQEMSRNPSYGFSDRTRSSDTLGSLQSRQSSVASTPVRSRRNTARGSNGRNTPRSLGDGDPTVVVGSLPADDGMSDLRRRIHEIRDLEVSNEEKAKRMHQIMTAEYFAHATYIRPQSPASIISAERPFTPSSPTSDMDATPATSPPQSISPRSINLSNPFNISAADIVPCYRPKPEREIDDVLLDEDHAEDDLTRGCAHYKRNVKVQCYDCKGWYPCRHCHDAENTHTLNRKKTENMLCMLCLTPQPAGQACINCEAEAACYYCGICKLWDDDSTKRIYHCPDCGICRRGEGLGKDYVHCKRCNVCITISHHSSHRCIERAIECDCPICGDDMFTSSLSVSALPCGHYMHKSCYNQYMAVSYKCPICQRSAINMEVQWRKLDNAIEVQPMPPQFRDTKALIQCNDCGEKGAVKYHWLGNKCYQCDSYNTTELRLLGGDEVEATRRRLPRITPIAGNQSQSFRRDSIRTLNERMLRPQDVGSRSPTSYFLNEQENGARRNSSSFAIPSAGLLISPVELLQRVGRSLSPMRHYLEFGLDRDDTTTDDDDMDFWGRDGRSGDEDYLEEEDEEDEEDDEDDSLDEEVESDEDDADDADERWEGIDLPGHR